MSAAVLRAIVLAPERLGGVQRILSDRCIQRCKRIFANVRQEASSAQWTSQAHLHCIGDESILEAEQRSVPGGFIQGLRLLSTCYISS